jgi:hypothetical protein
VFAFIWIAVWVAFLDLCPVILSLDCAPCLSFVTSLNPSGMPKTYGEMNSSKL